MRLIWLLLLVFSQALALPFQSTWFVSSDTRITLPLSLPNNITVDWGDGTVENYTTIPVSHLYGAAGQKNISVTGPIRGFSFDGGEEGLKIRNIMAWGEMIIHYSYGMFWQCLDLQITATDQPTFEPGTSLQRMFDGCINFNSPLNWDVLNVTDMTEMFQGCQNFNQPINFSNTHNLLRTHRMFFGATVFNQPVKFDTRSVTDMKGMFRAAAAFNQRLDFDTGNVLFMHEMFYGATSFNQPLNFTSTATVLLMDHMFFDAVNFNQLLNFDTSSVGDMTNMFNGATKFNQSLSFFNTSVVGFMNGMFDNTAYDKDLSMWVVTSVNSCMSFCTYCLLPAFAACVPCAFNVLNNTQGKSICMCPPGSDTFIISPTQCATCPGPNYVNNVGVCECAGFGNMTFVDNIATGCYGDFRSTWAISSAGFNLTLPFTVPNDITIDWGDGTSSENYTTIPISHVYNLIGNYTISIRGLVKGFTFMVATPNDAELITDVSNWGGFILESGVEYVFVNCVNIQVSATDQPIFYPGATLLGMFKNCNYFNSPLTWNIANVVSLAEMFAFAFSFNQPIHFSNADSVISMNEMFNSAQSFNKPLVILNTGNVQRMDVMFAEAWVFNQPLDFDTGNVQNMHSMFGGAIAFNQPLNFNTHKVDDMSFMFSSATAFNQRLDFDTRSLTKLFGTFLSAASFNSPINFSSTANVTTMAAMFSDARSFNQPLDFDTSAVVNMEAMFSLARKFNQMLNFNTSSVLNMDNMFSGSAMEQELTQWVTTLVSTCNNFCDYCGLPPFGDCNPCAAAFVNSTRGTPTCNCSVDELTNNTQCVPICSGLAYSYDGTAQNCSCVYGGSVNFVGGIAQGCNPAPECTPPAYAGSPGSCFCAPGFKGSVTYNGNIISGCRGFESVWYVPADNFNITLPLKIPLSITVDWGDGIVTNFTTLPVSHLYISPGLYTVIIGGIVTGFSFYEDAEASSTALVDISSWGGFTIGAYDYIFANCINLEGVTATDQPIFEPGASLQGIFSGCSKFNSALTWDITNVINLASMFASASMLNSPITLFNTHNVTDLRSMFSGAENFDQPLILNTANVQHMELMFSEATVFNQPLNFDTGNVQFMNDMFSGAAYFDQPLSFDTGNVLDMSNMFSRAVVFNQPLNFNTILVQSMRQMFCNATSFNQPLVFDTPNVVEMNQMFADAVTFNQALVLSNTASVTDMSQMFYGAVNFNQPLAFDTSSVLNMEMMFFGATNFNQILNFNTLSVLTMDMMFLNSSMEQDLTTWDARNTTQCAHFCDRCGLPSFFLCTPCSSQLTNSHGKPVCNCPSNEVNITSTQCAPSCLPPAFMGSAANCSCAPGYAGNPIVVNGAYSGCVRDLVFVSVWQIDFAPTSLSLPIFRNTQPYDVDWGSGYVNYRIDNPGTEIPIAGNHTIRIRGILDGFVINNAVALKLIDIKSWGGFTVSNSSRGAFDGCGMLKVSAQDQPLIRGPSATMENMFQFCEMLDTAFSWNITGVVSTARMFRKTANFNQPVVLISPDVVSVEGMFDGANAFNSALTMDTSKVTSMTAMFRDAKAFNRPLVLNTASVTKMDEMFLRAVAFNQPLSFITAQVTSLEAMFSGATVFNNQVDFQSTGNVLTTARMFLNAQAFNQPLIFDTANVRDMTSMFEGAFSFNQLLNFNTNQVQSMKGMFNGAPAFHHNLNAWNTVLVTNCLDFCPYCGVPSFSNCTVGCGLKNGAPGWKVCSCSSIETLIANTSCALNCVREYVGPAGNCSCAPGFNGTVTYPAGGYAPQGCLNVTQIPAANETIVRVAFVNAPLAIEATRGVQVFVDPDPALGVSGTVSVSTTEPTSATVSSIVSIVFYDEAGVEKKIENLTNRIRFIIPLRPGAADPIGVCRGDQPGEMVPLCNWFDPVSQAWSTSGCETNLTTTYVECSCTHLTDFAAVLPNYNRLAIHDLIYLDGESLASNPWGLITVICVLLLFAIVLFVSLRREAKEKIQENQREAKYAKWGKRLKRSPRFWRRYRTELQTKHTWGALLWPKTGASFRTVDRAFVTLLVLFILLAMSSMFHGRDQTYFGRGEVVVFSTLAALLPSLFFAGLFAKTGEMGVKEQWEHEHHVTVPSRIRCFRYRFPEWVRWVWRGMIVLCAVVLTWYILSVALMFDQNPAYYCLGETTRSWVVDFVTQYIVTVLLIEPCKVLLIAVAKSLGATNTPRDTKESDESYNELELGEQKPSTLPELPTISFAEIEITKPLGRGAFGKVDQCIWRGADCAIKRLLNPAAEQEYLHEVAMNRHLSPFKHQGVVSFLGVTQNPPGILLELYPLRSVEDYIITEGKLQSPDDLPKILTVLISASAGVVHLHMNRVVHRDIAARNFLIKKDLSTAVCDLGLALLLETGAEVGHRTENERKTDMLPINTTAPETLARGDYSPKSDVYMFGIFMWELFARRAPHIDDPDLSGTSRNLGSFATRIRAGLQLKIPPSWPEPLRVLMLACWALDPASRPSMITLNRALRDFRDLAEKQQLSLPPPLSQARVNESEANNYHQFVSGSAYGSYAEVPGSTYGSYAEVPGSAYGSYAEVPGGDGSHAVVSEPWQYQPPWGENKTAQSEAVDAVLNASPPASAAPAEDQPAASLNVPHQQGPQVAYNSYQPLSAQ